MPSFSGHQGAFTPATNQDNWTLEADGTGDMARVISIGWGGRLTTSTGYRTRWVRPTTAGASTFTALGNEPGHPGYATPLCRIGTFLTAPVLPTDPDNLHAQDWNAHGGVGYVVMPLAREWIVINGLLQGQISCRNVAGTDASGSSYGTTWDE